jgi:hypothetical protein
MAGIIRTDLNAVDHDSLCLRPFHCHGGYARIFAQLGVAVDNFWPEIGEIQPVYSAVDVNSPERQLNRVWPEWMGLIRDAPSAAAACCPFQAASPGPGGGGVAAATAVFPGPRRQAPRLAPRPGARCMLLSLVATPQLLLDRGAVGAFLEYMHPSPSIALVEMIRTRRYLIRPAKPKTDCEVLSCIASFRGWVTAGGGEGQSALASGSLLLLLP